MLILFALACATSEPKDTSTAGTTDTTGATGTTPTTVAITVETWDDAGSCWRASEEQRPAADWADTCGSVIDTGPRWAYDLYSEGEGCVRFPVGCDVTDAAFGACDAVAGCCDEDKLGAPACP